MFNHSQSLLILHFAHKQGNRLKPKRVRYDAKKIVCLPIGANGLIVIAILAQMGFKASVYLCLHILTLIRT